jgi:hypothetical protein
MMSLVTSVAGAVPSGEPIIGLLPASPETVGLVVDAWFDTDLAPHPVSVERVNKIESEIIVAFFVRVIIHSQSL